MRTHYLSAKYEIKSMEKRGVSLHFKLIHGKPGGDCLIEFPDTVYGLFCSSCEMKLKDFFHISNG